ncbi:tRNA (5-methylaminomethyl-2-thiouridine)(34)-methyltransferase MnmD [Deinococcus sp. Marseille-Q6407]|uniref:tRNA (5-methylaminomethyl-2-thiouridine)(34)-methyltransferase MnmD n=1 Tax=Deinococcus sp. Marseille-Q6407 TaxID=2969223 RepID=UPI0021C11B90|nr:tRNA (5-methylaminomethyl-2-thiouridine)(34)-methyltransferase MnmD [Deinococcus sp. Marseille-Q6407]
MASDRPSARELTAADLQPTADGSLTLRSQRFGQTYGSAFGAEAQARQVFVAGTGVATLARPRVLEIGFGVGQNLRATLSARGEGGPLDYLAYEYDPVAAGLLAELSQGSAGAEHPVWQEVLLSWPPPPGGELQIGVRQQLLRVRQMNVLTAELPLDWADAVYLDGFSPEANPELWTEEFLARVAQALRPGGVVATYSAAGRVRRALQAAGLQVEKCPGPPGKREFLRAVRP